MNDKNIDLNHYEYVAKNFLKKNSINKLDEFKIPNYLFQANLYYYKKFDQFKNNLEVLELGAGLGQNTKLLLNKGFRIKATDISPASIDIMKIRFSNMKNFSASLADIEKIPFEDESFDIICSAGSLSYGDNITVMNEIYRVLKKNGSAIILDSLDNNIIYKFNRYLRYLKNERSLSSIKRIPNLNLLNLYEKKFGYADIKFFGSITWCFPILKKILSEKLLTNFSNFIDHKIKIKKSAFKFVMHVQKKEKKLNG